MATTTVAATAAGPVAAAQTRALDQVHQRLLAAKGDVGQTHALLTELRRTLVTEAVDRGAAAAAVLAELRSGRDAPTGLRFAVTEGHILGEWPTWRVALLDWLAQLDPTAAADYAEEIFRAMTAPDEYAVALRNFAVGRPEGTDALAGHFQRLLHHGPWAAEPTAGYLEAFDVAVHLRAPALVEALGQRLDPQQPPAVRHAAVVAVDRLVAAAPADTLPAAQTAPALAAQPFVRAGLMARADVRDAAQRAALETYLAAADLRPEEAARFAALFPNANAFVAHSLLTENRFTPLREAAQLDQAALAQVRQWRAEGRFPQQGATLAALEQRLQEQIESATRGGEL
jgi:hypothetical protein